MRSLRLPITPITACNPFYAPGGHADRFVASDLGVDHPQVYGEFFDDGDTLWMRKEYSWDSRVERMHKTDAQYADDLMRFMEIN
jgi:hypothetical protein